MPAFVRRPALAVWCVAAVVYALIFAAAQHKIIFTDEVVFAQDFGFAALGNWSAVRIPHPPGFGIDAASSLPPFLRAADTEMRLRFNKRFETEEHFQEMVKNYYRLVTGLDRMTGRLV